MKTEQIWLDNRYNDDEYQEEDFFDDWYFKEQLENFIKRYEKRYNTSIESLLLISERESFYGDWNPAAGRTGYRLIKDLDEITQTSSDYVKIYVGGDNFIHIDYFDHDGIDHSVVKLIPESVEEKVYNDVGSYSCELDYVEILQKQGKIKPTKFWPAKK